ncbi:glycosyltransferase family 61 protein [Rhodocytophaga aerolata]
MHKNVLLTSEGIIFKNLTLIKESLLMPEHGTTFNLRYIISVVLRRKKVVLQDGNYLFVFNVWYQGYFHWLTECLPKLYLIKDFLHQYTLLLPDNISSFHRSSLKAFQFKEILYFSTNEYLAIPNLDIITQLAETGSYNIQLIKHMRSYFNDYFSFTETSILAEKIYISRRKASRRKIINEEHVEKLLSDAGFYSIIMEDFSFEEQIAIMRQCKYLISMHGAGLTNMLFMPTNTCVLEFRPEGDESNLCYFSLASALNIFYFYQFGLPNNLKNIHNADILIDVPLLQQTVEQMLKY